MGKESGITQTVLNNGVTMPLLGFGTWDLRGKECEQAVLEALQLGYRLIDTAQMYENEREVGRAIRKSGIPREEVFVTTKLYRPSAGYHRAKSGIEASLQELQMDYIDLLLIHEPYREAREMYQAMAEAYENGRVRAIGISNFNETLYTKFVRDCGVIPTVNQVEAHVYFRQEKLQKTMEQYGTAMEAWSPFAAGKKNVFGNAVLKSIGEAHGKSAAQIALKYLVQQGIIAIPKSSHKDRMAENMEIFDFQLTDEETGRIRALDEGKTLFGWY